MTRQILFTIPEAARALELSEPTIGKATAHLEALGIIRETTGRARKRAFVYDGYLTVLQQGTEPFAF